jgi:hypothetical protein
VQVPAKALDLGGSLVHQILAIVQKQLDLARLAVEVASRKVGLLERRPCDGKRVDRIGLPGLT